MASERERNSSEGPSARLWADALAARWDVLPWDMLADEALLWDVLPSCRRYTMLVESKLLG